MSHVSRPQGARCWQLLLWWTVAALMAGCGSSPQNGPAAPVAAAPSVPQAAAPAPDSAMAAAIGGIVGISAMRRPLGIPAPLPQRPAPADTAQYRAFTDNPWQRVAEHPVSTFSASVDTGSYANVRRFLNRGQWPQRDAVRVEELVNYFGYDYAPPPPSAAQPFAVHTALARSPWQPERGLLRVAIKGQDLSLAALPPANLVFLVDVSGSMAPPDRLPLLRSALGLLAAQLRPQDRITLVSYASGTRVVLPPTPGDQRGAVLDALAQLKAGGATAGEAGIRLAYAEARKGFIAGGINRVLLATDGDLNVGITQPAALKEMVEDERRRGIGLTTLGVGDSNYNELLMKQLADAGDGSYHYLDTLQEAHKVLVQQVRSTLAVIARDLKLQIEFNPAAVDEYRLIGYELHTLQREQFNDDKVDAGDIGAGHTVTALYEWVPRGARGNVDPLRYQPPAVPAAGAGKAHELAWVKLRYKEPGANASQLQEFAVALPAALPGIDQADADMRFATAVAAWGQWLRGSTLIGDYGPAQLLPLARGARGEDSYGHRAEFLRLVELSGSLRR